MKVEIELDHKSLAVLTRLADTLADVAEESRVFRSNLFITPDGKDANMALKEQIEQLQTSMDILVDAIGKMVVAINQPQAEAPDSAVVADVLNKINDATTQISAALTKPPAEVVEVPPTTETTAPTEQSANPTADASAGTATA